MKKYFIIVNLPIPCSFVLNDRTRFDLRTGIPNNSLEVFKTGFAYLGLKPGAEELFKKEKISDLILLIQSAKRIEDVEILALAKPENEKVQEAAKKKLEEFK
ncbi:hypothetical protein H8R23_05035 [Flavobacterium sp. F-380]|uniref:Uncharacterized protein n=1 Tax=Flavobacterium kayseriense TaxID=2764714 RepID=A0ABR7J5J8_9FLAO|nr:hypothetical protein [Flavobacterium kayseriense]MBC5840762.1 hypothetical protein [Flavobacterium kayseriense]MBC5846568.1 hypothetical protein [Flavobacterium kayseriense]